MYRHHVDRRQVHICMYTQFGSCITRVYQSNATTAALARQRTRWMYQATLVWYPSMGRRRHRRVGCELCTHESIKKDDVAQALNPRSGIRLVRCRVGTLSSFVLVLGNEVVGITPAHSPCHRRSYAHERQGTRVTTVARRAPGRCKLRAALRGPPPPLASATTPLAPAASPLTSPSPSPAPPRAAASARWLP